MRLHLGKPREPMVISRHYPTYIGERRLDKPALFVRWLIGFSWKTGDDFVFVGVKRFREWGKGDGLPTDPPPADPTKVRTHKENTHG